MFFFFLAFLGWYFFPYLYGVLNPREERKEKNIQRKKERKTDIFLNY